MEGNKIFSAINAVMSEIGAIGKNSKNQTQGFMYRGVDAVMNAINPALIKHKVFVVPTILDQTREERQNAKGTILIYSICKVKYTFYAEDGSFVEAIVIGEGMDSGDKATNKAMSIAFKYACFQVFCIPTEEMVDPDIESHEVKPQKTETKEPVRHDPTVVKVNASHIKTIRGELERTGIAETTILGQYQLRSIEDMVMAQFENCMIKLKKSKDKA